MIEEKAVVSSVCNYEVRVQSLQSSSCSQCNNNSSCATSLLDKFIGKREIVVDSDLPLSEGDRVLLGIEESAIIKSSILLYMVPLLAMFTGGLLGQYVAGYYQNINSDLVVAAIAAVFFASSLLIIRYFQGLEFLRFFARPLVIRKL